MSSVSSTNGSSMLRLTGMASGLDVDSTVKALMTSYSSKLDKMKQQRQLVQWRQDAYRDVISDVKSFKSSYFDILNRDKDMLLASNYSSFNVTATDSVNSTGTTSVTATANASAAAGQYLVHVNQLAQAAAISVDSPTYSSTTTLSSLGLGSGDITLSLDYGTTSNKVITINNSTGTKTVGDLITEISSQTSGAVVAGFSELTGKFTLKTSATGASTLHVDTGAAATALGISDASNTGQDASVTISPPGVATIGGGTTITRSSNSFNVDGVTYNLNRADAATQYTTLNVSPDEDKTFDKIKAFIDKYNELVDTIQTKIEEKKSLDYQPLTDQQKESMSEDQITAWEKKAKAGVLRSDSSLDTMLTQLRSAFYDKVEAAGISLSEVGLSTSRDTTERGKIILTQDATGEYKLKTAIKEHGEALVKLFTNQSDVPYSVNNNSTQRLERYNENGVFQRINDIFENYTTTSLDNNGHRGILTDMAGIKGTISEYSNSIYADLKKRDKAISEMLVKISDKETQLYKKFSTLETYLNQMNSQQSYLSSQLSS